MKAEVRSLKEENARKENQIKSLKQTNQQLRKEIKDNSKGRVHSIKFLGRDCGNREKPIRENRGQTPVTESGWGEVLGLCVSQDEV